MQFKSILSYYNPVAPVLTVETLRYNVVVNGMEGHKVDDRVNDINNELDKNTITINTYKHG